MCAEVSTEIGGWQADILGKRAQTPEAGRRGTRGLGRGLVPVHFQPHRHWLTVLVIMHLACGIWKH